MKNGYLTISYKAWLGMIDEIANQQEKIVELEQCLEITRKNADRVVLERDALQHKIDEGNQNLFVPQVIR